MACGDCHGLRRRHGAHQERGSLHRHPCPHGAPAVFPPNTCCCSSKALQHPTAGSEPSPGEKGPSSQRRILATERGRTFRRYSRRRCLERPAKHANAARKMAYPQRRSNAPKEEAADPASTAVHRPHRRRVCGSPGAPYPRSAIAVVTPGCHARTQARMGILAPARYRGENEVSKRHARCKRFAGASD